MSHGTRSVQSISEVEEVKGGPPPLGSGGTGAMEEDYVDELEGEYDDELEEEDNGELAVTENARIDSLGKCTKCNMPVKH